MPSLFDVSYGNTENHLQWVVWHHSLSHILLGFSVEPGRALSAVGSACGSGDRGYFGKQGNILTICTAIMVQGIGGLGVHVGYWHCSYCVKTIVESNETNEYY